MEKPRGKKADPFRSCGSYRSIRILWILLDPREFAFSRLCDIACVVEQSRGEKRDFIYSQFFWEYDGSTIGVRTPEVSHFPPRLPCTPVYSLRTVKVSNNNTRSISDLDGFGSQLLYLRLKIFLCMHNR
jgi:hypothetical protein